MHPYQYVEFIIYLLFLLANNMHMNGYIMVNNGALDRPTGDRAFIAIAHGYPGFQKSSRDSTVRMT